MLAPGCVQPVASRTVLNGHGGNAFRGLALRALHTVFQQAIIHRLPRCRIVMRLVLSIQCVNVRSGRHSMHCAADI